MGLAEMMVDILGLPPSPPNLGSEDDEYNYEHPSNSNEYNHPRRQHHSRDHTWYYSSDWKTLTTRLCRPASSNTGDGIRPVNSED
jgi:hypothetical protein